MGSYEGELFIVAEVFRGMVLEMAVEVIALEMLTLE